MFVNFFKGALGVFTAYVFMCVIIPALFTLLAFLLFYLLLG